MPALRRRNRSGAAASGLGLLTAVSIWLSTGILLGGGTDRIAALPAFWVLGVLAVGVPAALWTAGLHVQHVWPLAISVVLWLPYVPWRVGAAFQIWEGPIEGIVWLTVLAGLIAARPPRVPSALSSPSVAPWIAATVVAVSALTVFSQIRNVIPGGDEPHYLAATQSLLHDADLKVANNYDAGEYLQYFPGRLEPHFLKRSISGEIYSIHAPGVSVIVLPAFAIAGYGGAVWTMVLFAALTTALMWRLAFAVSENSAAAWSAVCGVCFSAPYFFHTFTIYPEIIGAFCVVAGVWLLVELAKGRDPSARTLIAAGALLAILPWLHSRFAVVAGIIGLLIAARLGSARKVAMFLAVPAIAAAGWFAFFYSIWGSPSPTAPYGPDTSTSASYILRGLIGLLFDQQFGVLTTAPIYAMVAAGAIVLFRRAPRLTIELALIVVPYAITIASYAMWWAGVAAPARFLVAILPLAALPLAAGFADSKTVRAISLVLIVISAALMLPRAVEDGGRFIYNNRSGVDATLRFLTSIADLPLALPSVHRTGGLVAFRDGLIWMAGLAIGIGVAASVARSVSTGARFTMASLLLAIVVMAGAQAAWAFDRFEPLNGERAKLVTLDRFRPSWQPTIVELTSWQRRTAEGLLNALPITMSGSSIFLDRVPAGDYVLSALPGGGAGTMRVFLGRNDGPIAEASLGDLRDSRTPFRLRLPVMARTLSFRIETAATGDQPELTLRPVGVVPPASRHPATRAARYGDTRAFFFDEWAYPESDGFWTRANGSATVVMNSDDGTRLSGLPISITAGAVPTTVQLSIGAWEESFTLTAGQKQDVMLPSSADGTWPLHIRSGGGFRPSAREPGNRDVRELAAWIVIR